MRCATVLSLLLLISPLERDLQQSGSPDDSGGQIIAGHAAVAPRPNPDAAGKYHVGDGVSPPKLVYAPDPEYTDKARRKKMNGSVVVSLTVDVAGKPQNVHVSRSLGEGLSKKLRPIALGLDESALKSVKEYRFEPAEFQGKPVPVDISVEVTYRIY